MATTERQEAVVNESRASARELDQGFTDIEAQNARYDVLNLETPNFAAGYFGTTREITASDHLGIYNAYNALKTAAPTQFAALRAALRKARS